MRIFLRGRRADDRYLCEDDGIELATLCKRRIPLSPSSPPPRMPREISFFPPSPDPSIRADRKSRGEGGESPLDDSKEKERKIKTSAGTRGGRQFDPGMCTEMCNYVIDTRMTHTHYTHPRSGAARSEAIVNYCKLQCYYVLPRAYCSRESLNTHRTDTHNTYTRVRTHAHAHTHTRNAHTRNIKS